MKKTSAGHHSAIAYTTVYYLYVLHVIKSEEGAGKSQRGAMSSQADSSSTFGRNAVKHHARGYQLEMLEESLKGNIIVAVLNGLYPV